MTPEDYREAMKYFVICSRPERVIGYAELASFVLHSPLSRWERGIAEAHVAKAKADAPVWYHAGLAGRAVGDVLVPGGVTGHDPRRLGKRTPGRLEFVYFWRDLSFARGTKRANEHFGHPSAIYEVVPEGDFELDPEGLRGGILLDLDRDLHQDPDWPKVKAGLFSSFRARAATVTRVLVDEPATRAA